MRAHLLLSGCGGRRSASLLGLPLAIWSARDPRVRTPVLGFAGLIQTMPALALLALFYPMLLILGRATGLAIPALGFLPALIALSLYALLPIVRNGVAALRGRRPGGARGGGRRRHDAAASGCGWSSCRLGAPVILAGIRTAAVWTIGAATLATTVGQPSLGDLIFSGLQTENWVRVLTGCAAAAALALAVDGLLALVESGLARRSRRRDRGRASACSVAALAFGRWSRLARAGRRDDRGRRQELLRAIYPGERDRGRLRAAGFATERRDNLGSTVAYQALAAGDIDVYVDYSGTLWTNILRRTDTPPARGDAGGADAELPRARDGVLVLGALGFENAYALAMRRERAEALGMRTLDDLAGAAPRLQLGTDLEFLTRPEWRAVQARYRPRASPGSAPTARPSCTARWPTARPT